MRWTGAMLALMAGAALQMQRDELLGPGAAGAMAVAGAIAVALGLALGGRRRAPGRVAAAAVGASARMARLGRTVQAVNAACAGLCPLIGLAGLCALAYAATDWRAAGRLQDRLAPALEGQDLVLTGVVAEMPRQTSAAVRFVFEVEAVAPAAAAAGVPSRVSLGWFTPASGPEDAAGAPMAAPSPGDRWRLPVRLRQVHGPFNPGGLDLELWLFERGVGATGTVRPGAQRLAAGWSRPVERWRQRIRDAVLLRVPDPVGAGVIAALAVGDQAAIDSEAWELFRVTGVAHLMSISGLHVTLFAWLAGAAVGRLWRRSAALMTGLPAPTAASLGGLGLAVAYALLAGWGVPAQRTVWMLAVVTALRLQARRWPLAAVLLSAATAVSLADPWALMQPGFWLSFAAVALLAASQAGPGSASGGPGRLKARADAMAADEAVLVAQARGWGERVRAALKTQWVVTIGLAPLTLLFFQQVSVVGFAANLVAIPLVTLVIMPLALAGMAMAPLWDAAAVGVQALMQLLAALAALPGSVWTAAAVAASTAALGLLGGALAALPLPWRLRGLGVLMMLPMLIPAPQRPPGGHFEAVVVDVGQGTAVVVRTRDRLLLYDAGPQYTAQADAGQRVLLPLLRWRGETAVDLLVLSHRDADHVGGAASLARGLPVRAVSSSLEPWHPLRRDLPDHTPCQAGQRWQWDGVDFEMLHPWPARDDAPGAPLPPNALSCVLAVTAADGTRLLLTGDIEAAQEAALVARDASALRSHWLLVPHHGSLTSSTEAFIDAVSPRVALVQAGYRSRFGHPAPAVERRYLERGVVVVRTDRCGAWRRRSDAPVGRCEREHRRRYWHFRASAPAP